VSRLKDGQRVRVVATDHPLVGWSGTVVRLRFGDDGAWVKMDDELPEGCALFPPNDSRARHALLYPDECAVTLS